MSTRVESTAALRRATLAGSLRWYAQFGGGLGDVFNQAYNGPGYRFLSDVGGGRFDGQRCLVSLVSLNPFAHELFLWHPNRDNLVVETFDYWPPQDDARMRAEHNLPSRENLPVWSPSMGGTVQWFPPESDMRLIGQLRERSLREGRPIVLFSVSAGTPDRTWPTDLARMAAMDVAAHGYLPVYLGRTFRREGREEIQRSWDDPQVVENLVDKLTAPGMAYLVREAAGVVAAHSATSMVAWHERRPQLLLYPEGTRERHFRGGAPDRDEWSWGADMVECIHGTFDAFRREQMDAFLDRVRWRLEGSI